MAKARHTRQLSRNQRAAVVVDRADELITRWWSTGPDVPIDDAGAIAQYPTLRWRTDLLDHAQAAELGVRAVRVTVTETDEAARAAGGQPVAVTVDLLLPGERALEWDFAASSDQTKADSLRAAKGLAQTVGSSRPGRSLGGKAGGH